ncbi:hypothetical protein AA0116_g8483 [Alternaria tenuissima]|nr:hypothetical protein AA0116_g8483 [Alternaria tenuissima]
MTPIEIAEGLKQRNAVRLSMLKDTKEKFNTIVDRLIDEHLSQSDEFSERTEKQRLGEFTTTTKTEPPSPDPKEFLRTMIKNARDDCEAAYKLTVSALGEARKKASEQREADVKVWSEIYQLFVADAVDTDKRQRYGEGLLYSPATASIRKHISDDCNSGLACIKKSVLISSVEIERIEIRSREGVGLAWLGYMREEKAYIEHLSSLELQASSAGIDLGCETTEQTLYRWAEEVSSKKEHY